jgi:hypothetical protein
MSNLDGPPKSPVAPAEKIPSREFSPEEIEQYRSLSTKFFEQAHDFETKDVEDTEWDETLTTAERELKSFDFSGSTKMAVEDPTRLNTAQRVLVQQLEGAIHYGQNPELFSPEMRPALEERYRDARQLFVDTNERLYPNVQLPASAEMTLRRVKNQSAEFTNPILKDYFADLPISNADSLRGGDPAKLLQQVESAIYLASGTYESAQGVKDPNSAKELAAFGKSLYTLELLRQDLEQRVEAREKNTNQTKPENKVPDNLWGGAAGNDEGYTKTAEAEKLRAARERLDMSEAVPSEKSVEARDTDWHSGPLANLLEAQTVEEARSMLTPQMEQLALSKALFDLDETIELGASYSARNPGKARSSKTLSGAWGLSVQANLGAIYQRIILAKTGETVSIPEIAQMPVSDFMKTAFGYDLAEDEARKEPLTRWTDILGHPTL